MTTRQRDSQVESPRPEAATGLHGGVGGGGGAARACKAYDAVARAARQKVWETRKVQLVRLLQGL